MSREDIKKEIEKLEYNPESLANLQNEAKQAVKNKEYLEAYAILGRIEELYDKSSQHLVNKALILYRLGEIQESIDTCKESLELDCDNQDASTLLQKLEDRLKKLRDYTMGVYQ